MVPKKPTRFRKIGSGIPNHAKLLPVPKMPKGFTFKFYKLWDFAARYRGTVSKQDVMRLSKLYSSLTSFGATNGFGNLGEINLLFNEFEKKYKEFRNFT